MFHDSKLYTRFCSPPRKIPNNVRTMSHTKTRVTDSKRVNERIEKMVARMCTEEEIGKFVLEGSKIPVLIFILAIHIAANGKLIAHHEIRNGQHFLI